MRYCRFRLNNRRLPWHAVLYNTLGCKPPLGAPTSPSAIPQTNRVRAAFYATISPLSTLPYFPSPVFIMPLGAALSPHLQAPPQPRGGVCAAQTEGLSSISAPPCPSSLFLHLPNGHPCQSPFATLRANLWFTPDSFHSFPFGGAQKHLRTVVLRQSSSLSPPPSALRSLPPQVSLTSALLTPCPRIEKFKRMLEVHY